MTSIFAPLLGIHGLASVHCLMSIASRKTCRPRARWHAAARVVVMRMASWWHSVLDPWLLSRTCRTVL